MEWDDNKFYGTLNTGVGRTRTSDRLQRHLNKKKRELEIKQKWPIFAELEEELANAEDEHRHQGIALDHLREERDLLKKLLGIDNGET